VAMESNVVVNKQKQYERPHSAEGLTRKGIFGKVRKKQTGEENVREY
jgi:hypothetical protein